MSGSVIIYRSKIFTDGRLPFDANSWLALKKMVIDDRKTPDLAYSKISQDSPVWYLVKACWAYEPSERPTFEKVVEQWNSFDH